MAPVLRVLLTAVLLLSGIQASSAQHYPTQAGTRGGWISGRRADRCDRAHRGAKTFRQARPAVLRREFGGAGGNIAAGQVARATPDGYTIMAISTGFVVNPSLYAKVPYDPIKDFAPVTLVAVSPNVVVVNPSVPAKTLPELVQLIRDNPGKYSYAGPGVGSTPHLGGELFRLTFNLDLVHVPFSGAGPAIQATIGDHTPIAFTALPPRWRRCRLASFAPWHCGDRTRGRVARRSDLRRTGYQGSGSRHAHRPRCAGRNAERDR